jgi:flagellar biosynthesis chaperone FliJ
MNSEHNRMWQEVDMAKYKVTTELASREWVNYVNFISQYPSEIYIQSPEIHVWNDTANYVETSVSIQTNKLSGL